MLRNILMLCPALAFALPFVAANPTMARPLATPAQPAEWGGWDNDDHDDGQLQLAVCTETQIFVGTGDNRSYSCEYVAGPQCLANCTAAAVTPYCEGQLGLGARAGDLAACQEQRAATCRSECEGGTAMFCSPELKARGWNDDDDDDLFQQIKDDNRDDDDNGGDIEEIVFVSTETCLDLDVEN